MTPYRCNLLRAANFTALGRFAAAANLSLVYGLSDMFGRPTKTKSDKAICPTGGGACPKWNPANAKVTTEHQLPLQCARCVVYDAHHICL